MIGKLRLIFNIRPNPVYKRLFDIGIPRLEKKLDIVHILQHVETGDDNTIDLDNPNQLNLKEESLKTDHEKETS